MPSQPPSAGSAIAHRRLVQHLFLVSLTGVLMTCAWGEGSGPESPSLIVSKAAASGDGQTGTVSAPLVNPLQVVVSSDGLPASDMLVVWQATGAGASVAPESTLTNATGLAATTWTLGSTPGTQTATATVAGARGSPVSFTATAVSGPVPIVGKVPTGSGDGQTGAASSALAVPLRVVVTLSGTPQSGITVAWASSAAGASMTPTSSVTDASGIASSSWTLGGSPGAQHATASVSGAAGSPVTFSATATAPSASDTVLVVNNQFNPATITVASGTTVLWLWPSNSLQHNILPVSPAPAPNSPTVVDGPFSYTFTFTTPGTYSYFCNIHGDANGTGMFATLVVQ